MHICVEVWHCSTHFESSSLVLLVLFATSLIPVFSALSDHYGTCRQHSFYKFAAHHYVHSHNVSTTHFHLSLPCNLGHASYLSYKHSIPSDQYTHNYIHRNNQFDKILLSPYNFQDSVLNRLNIFLSQCKYPL